MKDYDIVIGTLTTRVENIESKFDNIEKRMVKAELHSDEYARLLESYRDLLDRLKEREAQPHCINCGRVVKKGELMCGCCSLNAPCI